MTSSVAKSLAPPLAPLEVIIKKDTTLALRDHANGGAESRVSRDELIAILKSRAGKKAEQSVVISADKNVRYEEVINVMDMLQQQHIQKVGLLTQAKK
jgi:biopolymer transport protein TolR